MIQPSIAISRRGFLATAGAAATAAWLQPHSAFAQAASEPAGGLVDQFRASAATEPISVQSLRGNVSVLFGAGGNIGILDGKDGKFLVDAGMTGARPRMIEAFAKISAHPVRHVLNTHWHFDHTDGNQWLQEAGAAILAHANVAKRLAADTRVEAWNFTFPASPAGALPRLELRDNATLHLNGEDIALDYFGPSHTDGDVSARFTRANIFQTGDIWWNGHYPFIDYSTGGSINGMIRATETCISAVGDDTIVIPGHGPVGDRSALRQYHEMLVTVRDRVAELKKQGRSIDEVIAARPSEKYDPTWGTFVVTPEFFVRLVYAGV